MEEQIKLENEKYLKNIKLNEEKYKNLDEKCQKELKEKNEKIKQNEETLKVQEEKIKKQEELLKNQEENIKLEKEKLQKDFNENDIKLKLEIEKNKEKYNKDLKDIEDKLKKKEEQLNLEIEKYKKEIKGKEDILKKKEEELKLEKEKYNKEITSLKENAKMPTPASTKSDPLSLEGQEKIISNLLSEYLLKLNNSPYFISIFDLLNKTLIHYEQLKFFHNLDQKWQEPLDNLFNFYLCLKEYFIINQESATLNDFLFQKSFKLSEIEKEDNEIIEIIKSLKLKKDLNILDLYQKKREIFLKKVENNFELLKQKILSEKNKKDFKKRNVSMIDINERQKITEPKLEKLEVNFDEIINQDYILAKYQAYNSFSNLSELTIHISNVPLFLLYTLFVNCTDLKKLKIYFITDKSRQINNKNIDNLNDMCPIIIHNMKNLESFSLVDFPIKNNKLKDLGEILRISKIKNLSLINCFQKKDAIAPLIPYLTNQNTTLTGIDLSNHNCNILSSLNNTLLNYDINKKLTSITLCNCKLTDDDIIHISNYIVASQNLLLCDISKNIISTKACSQFGYCIPKSVSLETIKMSECGITPESLLFLFNGKGSKCLKNVIINGNDFGDIGLVSVSAFIKSSPLLETIEVKKCKGTDMGFITLVNSIRILPNSKLKMVNYQDNNITQTSLGILRGSNEVFKNKGIVFKINKIEGESIIGIDCAVFA